MNIPLRNMKLPKIAFGTWSWGGGDNNSGKKVFGNNYTQIAQLKPVFDKAYEKGYILWDTAYVYDFGGSESLLRGCADGREYFLSDKFTPLPGQNDGEVRRMLEGTLERMGREKVDLYWIHTPADIERWTKELIPLIEEGKISHVGVSNHSLEDIEFAQAILQSYGYCISAVQNHCSLIYRNSIKNGVFEWCKSNNAVFFPYMVLEQGALTDKFSKNNPFPVESRRARAFPPDTLAKLESLIGFMNSLGRKYDASAAEIAIAWALNYEMLPIIGATKVSHVEQAIRAAEIKLTDDEMIDLEMAADSTGVSIKGGWEKEM